MDDKIQIFLDAKFKNDIINFSKLYIIMDEASQASIHKLSPCSSITVGLNSTKMDPRQAVSLRSRKLAPQVGTYLSLKVVTPIIMCNYKPIMLLWSAKWFRKSFLESLKGEPFPKNVYYRLTLKSVCPLCGNFYMMFVMSAVCTSQSVFVPIFRDLF